MKKKAIISACESVGSQRVLAALLDISPATMNQWCSGGRPIPVDRCPAIEHATHGAVTCESLRDDVAWVRIADKSWPHPKGRPLVDHSKYLRAVRPDVAKAATAKVSAGKTAKRAA